MSSFLNIKNLGEIASIRQGFQFRGKVPVNPDSDFKVIQLKDIDRFGEVDMKNLQHADLDSRKEIKFLECGDILFPNKGLNHTAVLIGEKVDNTVCIADIFVIQLKPSATVGINADFLCWQLNQKASKQYIDARVAGSRYGNIKRQTLEQMPIKIPDLFVQEQISHMSRLATAEEKQLLKLIENRKQQIDSVAYKILNDAQTTLS